MITKEEIKAKAQEFVEKAFGDDRPSIKIPARIVGEQMAHWMQSQTTAMRWVPGTELPKKPHNYFVKVKSVFHKYVYNSACYFDKKWDSLDRYDDEILFWLDESQSTAPADRLKEVRETPTLALLLRIAELEQDKAELKNMLKEFDSCISENEIYDWQIKARSLITKIERNGR